MSHLLLLLLTFSLVFSSTRALLFGEPRIYGDDATGYGPVFEEQPQDLVYPEDLPEGKFSMNCRARANPPAKYKWWLNMWEVNLLELPNDHYSLVGGNLVVTNPKRDKHAGTYTCVAQNVYGIIQSQKAVVKFGFLNEFPEEERDAVPVTEGQGAMLYCAPPQGYPDEFYYRWTFNDFPVFIPMDKRRFVSQTTGNLYIARVEDSDAGNYSCFVNNPLIGKSVISKQIPLIPSPDAAEKRYAAHLWVKFPKTYALLAQNITFECFAVGNPVPEIRWRKVWGELPLNHEVSMDGTRLYLYNVQMEDEGEYECEALNVKGRDWNRAWLYVEAAPEWAEHINNTEKDIGSELTMACIAKGKPIPYIKWLKNGFTYGKGDLKFSTLTFEDSGMYQCIAENKWGTIYANAELRVIACAPNFEKNPVRRRLLGAKNGRVVIECKPRAAPKAKITWNKGIEKLTNSSRVRVLFDGSLEIFNATEMDEGSYTCYAENDRGKANSTGILTITEATEITEAPSDTEVLLGETIRLLCAASHDPRLDITFIWAVDTHIINFDQEVEHYERVTTQESSGDLLIHNTQLKHAGRYTCTAQTIVDNITASAILSVKGVPGPPGVVVAEEIRDKTVRLVWTHGSESNSPILKYTIQTRCSLSIDLEEWKDAATAPPLLDGIAESANVVDLYPWAYYEFRVIATNAYGMGEPSVPSFKIRTYEAVPVMTPTNIGGGGGANNELIITWTPVSREYYYGRKFGYLIYFKAAEAYDWMKVSVGDPETRRYVYKDYKNPLPNMEFQVKIKCYNSQGEGPFSPTAIIYSAVDVPSEAPTEVVARPLSATEAMVWWLPVFQQFVDGYQVKFWRKYDDNEAGAQRLFLPSSANQTLLENMLPDSHYLVEVRAYNGAGFGPPSDHYEMYTRKPPPSRRLRLTRTYSLFRTSINVAWEHIEPYENESFVEGYKVLYRKPGHIYGELYTTGWHSMDFPAPMIGDYFVEVRAHCEGGDGPISRLRIAAGATRPSASLALGNLLLIALYWLRL